MTLNEEEITTGQYDRLETEMLHQTEKRNNTS